MLYSNSGTLAGTPVSLSPFSGTGLSAKYLEVHNLHNTNTYTAVVSGATFSIPPARKLVVTEPVSSLTVDGTGPYTVVAGTDAVPTSGPRIEPSLNYNITSTPTSPADNVTIQDTGTVIEVKDAGLTREKVNTGIGVEHGVSGMAWLDGHAGNFADGEVVSVTVAGGTSEAYVARVAGVGPNEFTIGGGAAASLVNLEGKIVAIQPDVFVLNNGNYLDLCADNLLGSALTLNSTSINVTAVSPTVTQRAPGKVVTVLLVRVVTADDSLRAEIIFPLPTAATITGVLFELRTTTGTMLAFDGDVSAINNYATVTQGVMNQYSPTDVITLVVQYTL